MSVWRKLRWLRPSHRAARERDMQEELESLKAIAGKNELGNLTLVAEDSRRGWTMVWIEQLLQDFRYALRTLRRSPGFAIVVILTLALAIGMSTSVFSVLNAVLLRPTSYPDSNRLLWVTTFDTQWEEEWVSAWDFRNWQEQAQSFDGLVSYETFDFRIPTAEGRLPVRAAFVSQDFWKVSGVRPALGRLPLEGEENVLVLSSGTFERWLQSDPTAIGKAGIDIEGRRQTVIGVLPKEFLFEFPAHLAGFLDDKDIDVYRPPLGYGVGRGTLSVVGRLKTGVSIDQARAELAAIRERVASNNPRQEATEMELRLTPLLEKRTGHVHSAVWVLFGAVLFVLLIACANVANLLLSRASVRQKEIAIRASVGAGRMRVLRQFAVESSLLVCAGGATGLLLAYWAIAVIVRLSAKALPRLPEASMDFRVVLFALGASMLTAFVFGLTPMIALRRANLQNGLKDASKAASASLGGLRARRTLVALELAFAVVLVAGAGLMVKSFLRMNAHPDGFEPEKILVMQINLSGPQYFGSGARQKAYVDEVFRRVRPVAGVVATTVIGSGAAPLEWEGLPHDPNHEPPLTAIKATTPELAGVIGIRIVRGRWFGEDEKAIVINETLARRDFRGEDPIGKRMEGLGAVVGVVSDLKYTKLDAGAEPEVYLPFAPSGRGELVGTSVLVRTTSNPTRIAPTLRQVVAEIDKTQPALAMQTLEHVLADSIAPRRFNLFLLGTFAAAALLLALVGIYGVTAYSVAQRTHEIGVRMTLGARPVEVVQMMVRQGMVMACAGLTAGLVAAFGLTRLMASILYDVEPTDPATFALTALSLCATALAACVLPSLKAARVDPNIALRYE
jgi:putative ABC transport system permease protein